MSELKQDIFFTLLISLGFSALVLFDAGSYPEVQGQGFGQGPAFYPRLLAGGLGILAVFYAITKFSLLREKRDADIVLETTADIKKRPFLPFVVFFMTGLFVCCMQWVGFLLGGFLLSVVACLCISRTLTVRSVVSSVLVSAAILFLIWLIFSFFLEISLPGLTLIQ